MSHPSVVPPARPTVGRAAMMMLPGLLAFPVVTVVALVFVFWWIGDAEARGVDTTGHGFAIFIVFPLGGLVLLDLVLYLALLRRPVAGRIVLAVVNGGVAALVMLTLLAAATAMERGGVILAVGALVCVLLLVASVVLMWRPPFAAPRPDPGRPRT